MTNKFHCRTKERKKENIEKERENVNEKTFPFPFLPVKRELKQVPPKPHLAIERPRTPLYPTHHKRETLPVKSREDFTRFG